MIDLFKKRISILRSLKDLLKPRRKNLIIISIGKILILLLGLLMPIFNKLIIDDVLLAKKSGILIWICIGIIVVYVLETLVMILTKSSENKAYQKTLFSIKSKLWHILLRQNNEFYEEYGVGDLKNRLDNDMLAFEKFLPEQVFLYFFELITALAIASIIIFMNFKLAFLGLIILPLTFFITAQMGKSVTKSVEKYRTVWGEYENWLVNDIRGYKEVKALNIQKKEQSKFIWHWKKLCNYNFRKWMVWFANLNFIILRDTFIVNLSLYFIGAILIFNGEITVGSLLVFKVYYEKMMLSINKLSELDMNLSNDLPAIMRVYEMIEKEEVKESKSEYQINNVTIQFQNVSFKYNSQKKYALQDIQLTVKQGQKLAIVGGSGSGKSTLLKLIVGFYKPSKGEITIDGYPLKAIKRKELYDYIGIVMQENILFNMSIIDNLRLAKPSATMEEIINACECAGMMDVIERLPKGFNTVIGEGGSKLSGGQKQRLCIARVIIRNPKIIIFDEATSALDYQSEKIINETIEKISKEKTVIVIAHRLSSILSMERVVVLENGLIVGDGTHKELINTNKVYKSLFESQYKLAN